MNDVGIHNLDSSKLNEYSRRMAGLLIPAFPDETLASVMHSEDYFAPLGDKFVGAWVAEWANPFKHCDYGCNLMASTEAMMITVRWAGDHTHFANWDRVATDPDLLNAKEFIADIFSERAWFVSPGTKIGYGRTLKPDEIDAYLADKVTSFYTVESWRGTHDGTRQK